MTTKRGQSIVEFALIAILVILGIVFMGAYVLRSVNAHFKLWDEGVSDSFEENINQASLNSVPPVFTNCQCNATVESCGGPDLLCKANEREVDYVCNLPGCYGAAGNSTCEIPTDNSCCGCPSQVQCGNHTLASGIPPGDSIPCPVLGTNGIPSSCPDYHPPSNICVKAPANDPTNCYYGYHIFGTECGSTGGNICIKDASCPKPQCTGFILFGDCSSNNPSTSYCATQTCYPPTTGLVADTPNFYVGNGEASCSSCATDCCVYCNSPYVVNSPDLTKTPGTACVLEFSVAPVVPSCTTALPPGCSYVHCFNNGSNNKVVNSEVDCDYWPPWTNVTPDLSGQVCENSGSITNVLTIPYGAQVTPSNGIGGPGLNGGCGDPGEPSQTCAIEVNPPQ